MLDYTVVLLNYYTNQDLFNAIESVKNTSISDNYAIVVVNIDDRSINNLKINEKHVHVINVNENRGYAYGNNLGLDYAIANLNCKYTVIMNPDTLIVRNGTIDHIINEIDIKREKNSKIVGGQPLIRTAGIQTSSIREVYNYFDSLIQVFFPLRIFFKKRYKQMWNNDTENTGKPELFFVPAGSFFIIDTNVFKKLKGFDDATFLYEEEMILGYKLKSAGLSLLNVNSEIVDHEQGKSTQSHQKISLFAFKSMLHSKNIYLRNYLKVNKSRIYLLDSLFYINFISASIIRYVSNIWTNMIGRTKN